MQGAVRWLIVWPNCSGLKCRALGHCCTVASHLVSRGRFRKNGNPFFCNDPSSLCIMHYKVSLIQYLNVFSKCLCVDQNFTIMYLYDRRKILSEECLFTVY